MNHEHKAPPHLFATIGALTERCGRITTATSGLTQAGLEVACVGDAVTHDDGSEAVIIDIPERQSVASSVVFRVVAHSPMSR